VHTVEFVEYVDCNIKLDRFTEQGELLANTHPHTMLNEYELSLKLEFSCWQVY